MSRSCATVRWRQKVLQFLAACAVSAMAMPATAAPARVLFDARHYSSPAPAQGNGIAIGDFDEDGFPDAILGGDSAAFAHGRGDGSFESTVLGFSGSAPVSGDFDEDGHLDAAFAYDSNANPALNAIRVVLGDGAGSFSAPAELPCSAQWLATGDLDGDGHLDIVAARLGADSIAVLKGDGHGGFAAPVSYRAGSVPYRLIVQDVTGDGLRDVVVADLGAFTVSMLRGLPGGGLAAPVSLATSETPGDVAAGDCNEDGFIDLVAVGQDHVTVFPGQSGGSFGSPIVTPSPGANGMVQLADVDGDSHLDVFVYNEIRYGSGSGAFPSGELFYTLDPIRNAIADLDANGHLDLVAYTQWGNLRTVLGNGGRSLGQLTDFGVGVESPKEIAGDLNEDGLPELVAAASASSEVLVYLNLGGRHFASPVHYTFAISSMPPELALGDFDEDGHLDLLAFDQDQTLWWFRGHGDGTLDTPVAAGTIASNNPMVMQVVDMNHDGHLDVVAGGDKIVVMRGAGNGTFTLLTSITLSLAGAVADMALADLDEDGSPDIVYSRNENPQLVARLSNGSGRFVSTLNLPALTGPAGWPAIADLDGDGHMDVAAVEAFPSTSNLVVFHGNGNGTFTTPVTISSGQGTAMNVADADGDGVPDLLMTTYSSEVEVFLNRGANVYERPIAYGLYWFGKPQIADLDGDVRPDILTGGPSILFARPYEDPAATVVSPRGGEQLAVGSATTLRWRAADNVGVTGVDLLLSRTGRYGTYATIASNVPNTGSFNWTVSGPGTSSDPAGHFRAFLKVVAHDAGGRATQTASYSGIALTGGPTAVPPAPPAEFALEGVAPNPIHREAHIVFALARTALVRVDVLDAQGRLVTELIRGTQAPGRHDVAWRPAARVAPGVYFVRYSYPGGAASRRVAIVE